MKKFLVCLITLITCLNIQTVKASGYEIEDIHIDVVLQENGSATFQETWNMDVSEGTEIYKVFNNMDESNVKLISVENDLGEQYKITDDWDIDLSKEENQRILIREGAKLANKNLTKEMEDKIILILKEKGISSDLLNYVK